MTSTQPLFSHQKQTVKFLTTHSVVYDASDPGTGKTRGEIEDIAAKIKRKPATKVLILAPKSILQPSWGNDLDKFAPQLTYSIATATNREAAFKVNANCYITNIDAAVWLAKKPKSFWKNFEILIIDEATSIKHRTSQRAKAVAKISKFFSTRRLMSGTPNSNGVTDLWHQYFILDDGKRLGKSFFAFRAATQTPTQLTDKPIFRIAKDTKGNVLKGPDGKPILKEITPLLWTDKPNIEPIVAALVNDITIRHEFDKCVDIPENHQYAVPFELSKKHMNTYRELEAFSIARLNKNTSISAVNKAVLYMKLMQTASGAVYDDNGGYSVVALDRYELVLDLVEAREHSIVFFNWVHQRDEMLRLAQDRGYSHALIDGTVTRKEERDQIVAAFEKGFYKVLFAHPQSAGHGLTLNRASATIWASPTYNLEHYLQGLKRIHRIGQTKKTETIMVIAKDTVDEHVWQALQDKNVKLVELLGELA